MAQRLAKITVWASFRKVVNFIILAIVVIVCVFLFLFRVSLSTSDYDLVLIPHFSKTWFWGVNYDGNFEFWKVSNYSDGSIENHRLFP